jgi:NAD(P)-dependent dehydrogenase (short-subunit alcohol dehydrogenase family)
MKNYLIIGASSGIGLALANQLSADNMVYGTYHNSSVESTKNLQYFPLNVLDATMDFSFLPDSLDGLVYCPGSIQLKPFNRFTPEDFMIDYHLQVLGAVKIIQALMPRLKKAESSSIVLFSTVAVQMGFNFHSLVAASKGAIEGLAKSLSAEFSPKIRVNCIAPSLTNTPLAQGIINTPEKLEANANKHPLKRIGTANDIANTAAFLLSNQSSWITGQILHVDGGISTIKI